VSSLPDSDKVRSLRLLVHEHKKLCKELAEVRATAAKLDSLEEQVRSNVREITLALDNMDCKADGNAGWERRIVWMLTELITQEEES
jgi:hypothetical protein